MFIKEKFVKFYMNVARSTSSLSHAKRLQVGAVIVKDNNILSFGYNGMPAGMTNECEVDGSTKPEVIHAEANAISKLARQTGSGQDSTMFITHAPCVECAKLIIQSGIKAVYWETPYRDDTGLKLLSNAGIITVPVQE